MSPIVFPVADGDIVSAYVAAFVHVRGWDYLTQPGRRELNVIDEVRRLTELSDDELVAALLDPAFYRHWRATLVQVRYDGEVGPYQERGQGGLDHLVIGPLHCSRPLWVSFYDLLLGRLLGKRAGYALRAVREVPVGRPAERKRRPLLPDLTIGPGDDPPVALGRYRQKVKARGDERLASGLRVVLSAGFYGVFGQEGGRLYDPVLAATIPAVVRCWLALAEHLIRRRGGIVAARDTDGLAVPCSPEGGTP